MLTNTSLAKCTRFVLKLFDQTKRQRGNIESSLEYWVIIGIFFFDIDICPKIALIDLLHWSSEENLLNWSSTENLLEGSSAENLLEGSSAENLLDGSLAENLLDGSSPKSFKLLVHSLVHLPHQKFLQTFLTRRIYSKKGDFAKSSSIAFYKGAPSIHQSPKAQWG